MQLIKAMRQKRGCATHMGIKFLLSYELFTLFYVFDGINVVCDGSLAQQGRVLKNNILERRRFKPTMILFNIVYSIVTIFLMHRINHSLT